MVIAPLAWGVFVAWLVPKLRRPKIDNKDMQAE